MVLTQHQLDAIRALGTDLIVFAGSAKPGDVSGAAAGCHLTDVQLRHILTDLRMFFPGTDPDPREPASALYEAVTGSELPGGYADMVRAVSRLDDCLSSIPLYDDYAALYHDYWHGIPQPREGRTDDPDTPRLPSDELLDRHLASAMTHMCDIARVNYIVSGITDLKGFGTDELETLHDKHIYVRADLDRFTDRGIIMAFADDPELVGRLCVSRL